MPTWPSSVWAAWAAGAPRPWPGQAWGPLTLVDQDTVGLTNLNRQILALHSTLDQPKAQAMARRVADINPGCRVTPLCARYEAADRERFFTQSYDYLVDAIDLVSCKLDLIQSALARDIPVVSALGTGNKLDASRFEITDIAKTTGCPLARIMRKELRRRGIEHLKVVFSPEQAAPTQQREGSAPGAAQRARQRPVGAPHGGAAAGPGGHLDLISARGK